MQAILAILVLTNACIWVNAGTYTNAQAKAILAGHSITVHSSGNCETQSNPSCTSLQGIHQEAIDCNNGVVQLKAASGCTIQVTGGTEVGHAAGTYSHANGWKLDIHMTDCLTNYIKRTFTAIGGDKWQAASGNVYFDEGDHWDITFHPVTNFVCTG